jgi:RHS repeat-associated protein
MKGHVMPRPNDWWVLDLDKDPTPGDPARVDALGDRFLDFSEVAERAYRSVTSLQGDSAVMSWVGLSGDAFREHFGEFPEQLRKLYTSHQLCGDALTVYSPQLSQAQAQADRALADGREARDRLGSTTSTLATAQAGTDSAASHAEKLKNPDKTVPAPDPDQVAQAVRDAQVAQERQSAAQGAVDSAEQALEAAKSLAEQARALRTTAAQTCAKQIDEASDAGIKPRSFWQKLAEAFKKLWDIICEIAKWVALVAGVIAMIIGGPLAWVALAAGVILLIKAIIDFAQGHGSIMDLIFGIIGVIPGVKGLTTLAKLKDLHRIGGFKEIGKATLTGMKNLISGLVNSIRNTAAAASQIIQRGLANSIRKINALPAFTSKGTKTIPAAGDPVDVSTGRMFLTQNDLHLPGTLPVMLERTHRSDYRLGRAFGPSWASWLDQRLEVEATAVHLLAADGMLLSYPVPEPGSSVLPVHGAALPLRRDETGYVVVEPHTGRTLHFAAPDEDGSAGLLAVTDRAGNRIDLLRNEFGTVVEVHHSGGYRVAVESTTSGLVTALKLLPRQGEEQDVHGSEALPLTTFTYENRRLVEALDLEGRAMRFRYDQAGRIVRWEDRNGMWYGYTYDADGRCVSTQGRDEYLSYRFSYDTTRNVTTATDSLGATTTYQLNDDLQVIAESDPLGATTHSVWDAGHQLLARTDPLGATTSFSYDESGNVLTIDEPDGLRTTVEYAGPGLPIAVTAPDGSTWRREYDETGNVVTETDPLGVAYRYAYPDTEGGAGTPVEAVERDAAGLPIAITGGSGVTFRIQRDRFGRPVEVIDALGAKSQYRWTVDGDLLEQVGPDGGRQQWTYDGERNVTSHLDENGRRTQIRYAGYDLAVERIDATGARTQYGYDTERRLTAVTNPGGRVWRFEYDVAGRLVREVDFDGREQRFGYDLAGRLIREVDASGRETEFGLDARGNVIERRTSDGTVRFRHDQVGRLVQAIGADAEVTFERDALGRIVAETVNGRTLRTRHDVGGRVIERLTPSGAGATWAYDEAGNPTQLTTAGHVLHFGYDEAGRETSRQLDANVLLTTDLDAAGRPITQLALVGPGAGADVAQLLHRYTAVRRLGGDPAGLTDGFSGAREIEQDRLGRVIAVLGENGTERYAYNDTGDIVAAAWPGDAQNPAAGDREYDGTLLVRAGSVRYTYDEHGRTVSRTQPASASKFELRWDAAGRMTGAITPDGERWRYRYDPFGRRIAKERTESLDDRRERVVERIDFTWSGDVLVEEVRTGADGATRVTTWDRHPNDDRPLTQTIREQARDGVLAEQFTAVVTDLIGTPSGLVNPDGRLTWQRAGNLWGLDAPGTPSGMPLRMPGQYLDDETGLHYNYQRYYDPASGRYLSPDPLGLLPAPNPVTYVRNPLTHADPLGLGPVCATYFGMFPAPPRPYITHVGAHGETKQWSQQFVRESEHVMPMAAIRGSGIPSHGADNEITVSMPYLEHQNGRYGRGNGVSSTGSSYTATQWSSRLATLLRNGQNYDAYRLVVVDAVNVNKHAAPGIMHYLDEIGRGSWLPPNVPARLTAAEVADLKRVVVEAYTNSRT